MVIPAHNAEAFIRDAVLSVLRQEPRPDEVVVVDDGSTDQTASLLADFGKAIQVISQPRSGVAGARNRGIEESAGEYVAFLDADDLWLPGKLAAQLQIVRQERAGLVGCGYVVTDEHLRPRYAVPGRNMAQWIRDAATLDEWGLAFPITALVDREIVESAGGFSSDLSTSADLEFALRVAAADPTGCVGAPLAVYRTHAGQMHHDLARFEQDMRLLYERLRGGGLAGAQVDTQRALANLHTRLLARRLLKGEWSRAVGHARDVLRYDPARLVAAPAEAAVRRSRYRRLARSLEPFEIAGVSE